MGAKVLLFGSGYMGTEYGKVLRELDCDITVIGRDEQRAKTLAQEFGGNGFGGGITALEQIDASMIDLAIIAVSIESLKDVALAVLGAGVKNILVEKPGGLDKEDLTAIKSATQSDVNLRIAHNRRFYNSVIQLKKKIDEDGGALGCFFDFTEREKDINFEGISDVVAKRWGFANSTHVIDTAFHLVGEPKELIPIHAGENMWPRHPSGTIFSGCGVTASCPFTYFATWRGAGRWNVEVSTKKGRYKLCPMEELQFCESNQFVWSPIELEDNDDARFKPGLLKLTRAMLDKSDAMKELPTIDEQLTTCMIVDHICGYVKGHGCGEGCSHDH